MPTPPLGEPHSPQALGCPYTVPRAQGRPTLPTPWHQPQPHRLRPVPSPSSLHPVMNGDLGSQTQYLPSHSTQTSQDIRRELGRPLTTPPDASIPGHYWENGHLTGGASPCRPPPGAYPQTPSSCPLGPGLCPGVSGKQALASPLSRRSETRALLAKGLLCFVCHLLGDHTQQGQDSPTQ